MKIKLFMALSFLLPLSLAAQNKDWANYSRYAEANAKVTVSPKAVLFGDSITDAWPRQDPDFFNENNLVGRGISGQTTTQILCRMREDVVNLRPKYVVILAGINDIAINDGHAPDVRRAVENIKAMCDIAKANKIKPVICSLLPSYRIGWRPSITDAAEKVAEFNALLKAYAKENKIAFADYYMLFADENNHMPEKYSKDTVHPNIEGYRLMESCLLKFLK
ncbi:MAG: GDSL-type esterase/lipase family protein [Bacteroidales bacterium]|nr:GDSL-type esterase/lipase family protein [Bacteroidales bacterium]